MKTVNKWLAAGSGIAALLLFIACNKNNSSTSNPNIPKGQSQVSVYMMDDPIQLAKVLIDIRQIAVQVDTASKQTDSHRHPHSYDHFSPDHSVHNHNSLTPST